MKGDLSRIATGTFQPQPIQNPSNTMYMASAEQCSMQPTPGPTPGTTAIDPSQLIQRACGYFELDVNASATTVTADVIWGFGPLIAGNGTINKQLYTFPGIEFAVDTAGFTDAFTEVGTANASAGSSAYINDMILPGQPYIIGGVTFTDGGSAAGVFATQATQPWISQNLQMAANFESTKLPLSPNKCSPCINDTFNVIQWDFTAPISRTTPLSLRVKDGLIGSFRFCTKSNGVTYDFIEC